MKNYIKIFAPVTLVLLFGSLTLAFAQTKEPAPRPRPDGDRPDSGRMPPPFGPGLMSPRMFDELGLTAEQRAGIVKIHDEAMSSSKVYFERLEVVSEKLRDLNEPETFDETEARALLKTRNEIQTEIEIIRMKAEAASFALLTGDQIAKFSQLKSTRPGFGPREGFLPPPPDSRQKR